MPLMHIIIWMVVGVLIGALSGFMGVGGGVVLTPILIYLGFKPKEATVTSLAFIIPTAWAGMMRSRDDINVNLSVVLAVGAVIGTYAIGRPLVEQFDVNPALYKRIFGVLMLLVALDMVTGFTDTLKNKANVSAEKSADAPISQPRKPMNP
ncbi:MAG: sulfite exporter TauE/SafE family protein [Abditibacteriales bacterium]|nr:sulfite exporter TauE/SafE family protein [Abditibacteriales bacterium]MDW8364737.1 sulfite exporter TauE/SafE family protein [Abditibacteriales bacterium]